MKLILLSAIVASGAAHATCPINECNYLDPEYVAAYQRYQAAFANWSNCLTANIDQFFHAMDMQAVLYPRFGIAWHALQADMKAATHSDTVTADKAAIDEARRRFEDRILRTAEPEALEFYNLWQLKVTKQSEQCGPAPVIPEPPRGQPK